MGSELVSGSTCFTAGRYTVNLATRQVFFDTEPLDIPWRQFEALRLLVEAGGNLVEREKLLAALWPGITVEETNLNQCISQLRKSLNDNADTGLIQTVPRLGYRLSVPPQPLEHSAGLPRKPVRWWWVLLAAFAAVAFLGWAGRGVARRARAEALVNEGLALIRLNQFQQVAAGNALIEQALEISPDLPIAYAALAEGMVRSSQGIPGQPKEVAMKALALDPNCGPCLAIAGWVLMSKEWEWKHAMEYLDRAAKLTPRDPRVLLWHAQILAVNGRLSEASNEADRAIDLQPGQVPPLAMKAGILYLQRNFQEADVTARKALSYQPTYSTAWTWLYRIHGQLREFSTAVAMLSASRRYFTGASADQEFARSALWQELVDKHGIGEWVQKQLEAEAGPPIKDMMRYEHATWRMWMGDREGALGEIESLFAVRPYDSMYLAVDPAFNDLHGEPRFRKVVERMGLSERGAQ